MAFGQSYLLVFSLEIEYMNLHASLDRLKIGHSFLLLQFSQFYERTDRYLEEGHTE